MLDEKTCYLGMSSIEIRKLLQSFAVAFSAFLSDHQGCD